MQEAVKVEPSEPPKRYHPLLVTLHWLIVLLVFTDLYLGLFVFKPLIQEGGALRIPESALAIHMAVGIAILVLIVVRFFVRTSTKKPAAATAGNKFLDFLAGLVHYALYFFVFAITVVGLVFAVQTDRLQRAFLGGGNSGFEGRPVGGNFGGFPTAGLGTPRPSFGGSGNFPGGNPGFQGNGSRPGGPGFPGGPGRRGGFAFFLLPLHLYIAVVLSILICFHILAALYHQFIRKDQLIGRMWYGKA
jgi:cytochrome b561